MKNRFLTKNDTNFFKKPHLNFQFFLQQPFLLFFVNCKRFKKTINHFAIVNCIQFFWIKKFSEIKLFKFKNFIYKKHKLFFSVFKVNSLLFYNFKIKKTFANCNSELDVIFQPVGFLRFSPSDFNLNSLNASFVLWQSQRVLIFFLQTISFFLRFKNGFKFESFKFCKLPKKSYSRVLLLNNPGNL